jgi:hypothetical protein
VIQLTYSFVWFNEPFDAVIGVSLVFLGASGGLLLYQYIRDYRYRYRYPAGANLDVDHHTMLDVSEGSSGDGDGDGELQKV